jgi:hypothetical protein
MYNTKFICTYNTDEIFNHIDKINIDEKNFVRDAIYRQELLEIFCMKEFDEMEMDRNLKILYNKIKNCNELKECMLKLSSFYMSTDEEIGLMILYAFDYMYISHLCVSEYLDYGKISDNNLSKLKSIIFY